MALGTPAWAAGSATIPTRVLRHLPAALTGIPVASYANSATGTTRGGGYGVAGGGDLLVTTTGSLGYSVAAGHYGLPGTSATAQGMYVGYNDAAVTGTLPARNATNPYIAYICVQIRDTDEDATGSEDATIVVIQGTAAASPSPPSVPSSLGSLLILSEALVPSSANGGPVVFTDRRMYLSAIGGLQRVTTALRPTGAAVWEGLPIYDTTLHHPLAYNATSSAFRGIRPVKFSAVGGSGVVTGASILSASMPATGFSGAWVVTATLMFTGSVGGDTWIAALSDGVTEYAGARARVGTSSEDISLAMTGTFATVPGTSTQTVSVTLTRASGTGSATVYSDLKYNRVDCIFIPDP